MRDEEVSRAILLLLPNCWYHKRPESFEIRYKSKTINGRHLDRPFSSILSSSIETILNVIKNILTNLPNRERAMKQLYTSC